MAGRDVLQSLADAMSLVDAHDYGTAAGILFDLLDQRLPPDLRAEIQHNLATALCLVARAQDDPDVAGKLLNQAHAQVSAALQHRTAFHGSRDWTISRANQAVILLDRHQVLGDQNDLTSAHFALDGVEQAAFKSGDTDVLNWVRSLLLRLQHLQDRHRLV